jgi:hypothetical protein
MAKRPSCWCSCLQSLSQWRQAKHSSSLPTATVDYKASSRFFVMFASPGDVSDYLELGGIPLQLKFGDKFYIAEPRSDPPVDRCLTILTRQMSETNQWYCGLVTNTKDTFACNETLNLIQPLEWNFDLETSLNGTRYAIYMNKSTAKYYVRPTTESTPGFIRGRKVQAEYIGGHICNITTRCRDALKLTCFMSEGSSLMPCILLLL